MPMFTVMGRVGDVGKILYKRNRSTSQVKESVNRRIGSDNVSSAHHFTWERPSSGATGAQPFPVSPCVKLNPYGSCGLLKPDECERGYIYDLHTNQSMQHDDGCRMFDCWEGNYWPEKPPRNAPSARGRGKRCHSWMLTVMLY